MSVLVSRERLDPVVSTDATTQMLNTGGSLSDQEEINSEAELLKSSDVLEKVVLANGLQNLHISRSIQMFLPKRSEADRVARAVRTLAKKLQVDTGNRRPT